MLAAVMLVGFGTAGIAFASMVTASAGVADRDQGLVGGVINTSRQLGAAVGAALLPAVADAVDRTGHSSMAVGDRAAMLTGAVTAGLATVIALRTRPSKVLPAAPMPGRSAAGGGTNSSSAHSRRSGRDMAPPQALLVPPNYSREISHDAGHGQDHHQLARR